MKAELIGGQYDGKIIDVPDPVPPKIILADLASYDHPRGPMYDVEGDPEPYPITSELRTLTYERQYRGTSYTKKLVYNYVK